MDGERGKMTLLLTETGFRKSNLGNRLNVPGGNLPNSFDANYRKNEIVSYLDGVRYISFYVI